MRKYLEKYAFSLIELMVSMVVISVIMAAFTPIVTKRMKANSVAMKLGDTISATKCETWINSNCRVCLRKRCVLCSDEVKCNASQYLHVDDCTCHACSEYNANCISCSVSRCKTCRGGYGYSSSSPYCTQCQIGTYSDGTSACKVPNPGFYTDTPGASAPKPCEEGSMCINGVKTTCKNGSWSSPQSSSCNTKCPEGYYCQNGVKTVCAPGKWSNAGSSTCSISCPAGYACSNGSKSACSAGTYSTGGAGSCTSCSAGYACSSTGQKICAAGTYAVAGATSCITCSAGTYNTTAGSASCAACGDGYYCSGGKNRVACSTLGCAGCNASTGGCTSCAAGATLNGTTCSACPDWYYCPAGGAKKDCDIHRVCNKANGPTGNTCPEGQYGNRSACVSCGTGCKTCAKNGASFSNVTCAECKSGYVLNNGSCTSCSSDGTSWAVGGTCQTCDNILSKLRTSSLTIGKCVTCAPIDEAAYSQGRGSDFTCTGCPDNQGLARVRNANQPNICVACPYQCKKCEFRQADSNHLYPYCTECFNGSVLVPAKIAVGSSSGRVDSKICLAENTKSRIDNSYSEYHTLAINRNNVQLCDALMIQSISNPQNYGNVLECIRLGYRDGSDGVINGCILSNSTSPFGFQNTNYGGYNIFATMQSSNSCGLKYECINTNNYPAMCRSYFGCKNYSPSSGSSTINARYCVVMEDWLELWYDGNVLRVNGHYEPF